MRTISQFRAKIPKISKVFKIIECVALACNVIISIAAFTYFSNKPQYKPVSPSHILVSQSAPDNTTCSGAYKFSSQDAASSAGHTLNSLNVALVVVAVITLTLNCLVLLVRMVRQLELNRLRLLLMMSIILGLLQLPLFFALLNFNYDKCLSTDSWNFVMDHFKLFFYLGLAIFLCGLVIVIIVGCTRKLGECALQLVLGIFILSGFYFVIAFVGTIMSVFFSIFSIIEILLALFALLMTIQEVKKMTGNYESNI